MMRGRRFKQLGPAREPAFQIRGFDGNVPHLACFDGSHGVAQVRGLNERRPATQCQRTPCQQRIAAAQHVYGVVVEGLEILASQSPGPLGGTGIL